MDKNFQNERSLNFKFRQSQILVIEDNPDHWAIIRSAIQDRIPEVAAVRVDNAASALLYLHECVNDKKNLPQLILLDLYLPNREDGWGLLNEIKKEDSPFLQVPVVVLSYSNNITDISEVYNYGATAYLLKPENYKRWLDYFETLRQYWWNTVTLPGDSF